MATIKPADTGRANRYDRAPMTSVKFLWPDGSITDSLDGDQ